MNVYNANRADEISKRFARKNISTIDPFLMVFGRTALLVVVGLIMWAYFWLVGGNPVKDGITWWPFQVMTVNIMCFFLLRHLAAKEGIVFSDLLGFQKTSIQKDILSLLLFVPVTIIAGGIGLYGSAYIIFGTTPPTTMFQPMPLWAAAVSLILFPISNALVELTTYFGYSMPRLEQITKSKWLALAISAGMLSLQHTAFPLVPDGKYFLWRAVGFIPLACAIGLMYRKIGRLAPLVVGHYLMDLQLILMVFMASVR